MNDEHIGALVDFALTLGLVMAFVFFLLLATDTSNRLLWASAPALVYISVTAFHYFRGTRATKKAKK